MQNKQIGGPDKGPIRIAVFAGLGILALVSIAAVWSFYGHSFFNPKDKNAGEMPDNMNLSAKRAITSHLNGNKKGIAVPADLIDAGEFAENIYDAAKSANWTVTDARLTQLKTSIGKLEANKVDTSLMRPLFPELSSAIAARNKKSVLVISNEFTFKAAETSSKFNLKMPVEITKLDFYGRELEIWAEQKDLSKLKKTAVEIRKIWDAVKPAVLKKNGTKESEAFELLVKKVDAANSVEDFAALATPILDEVDILEAVFE